MAVAVGPVAAFFLVLGDSKKGRAAGLWYVVGGVPIGVPVLREEGEPEMWGNVEGCSSASSPAEDGGVPG